MTLDELMHEWLYDYNKRKLKLSSFHRYEQLYLSHIRESDIAGMQIEELKHKNIQPFINELMQTISGRGTVFAPKSVNFYVRILHAALEYAVDCGYLEINPCDGVKRAKVPKTNILLKCFQIEEQRTIERFCYCRGRLYDYAIVIACYTGMRLGEIAALTWENVDLENDIIHVVQSARMDPDYDGKYSVQIVTPKTESSIRDIPLSKPAADLLFDLHECTTSDFVFHNKHDAVCNPLYLSRRFHKIVCQLHVNELPFHSLRHTFATRALEAGADPKTLSEILGHTLASTTLKIYGHSTKKQKHETINKLERIGTVEWK